MTVNSVSMLCVNGGRFAEIKYGVSGEMSVMLNEADPVASLFASADAEFEAARNTMRRAMRMRNAAWKISKTRGTDWQLTHHGKGITVSASDQTA